MIQSVTGDIFDCTANLYVNPVNALGVSGAGLARRYKEKYPEANRTYEETCALGLMRAGSFLPVKVGNFWIGYAATKGDWRKPSRYGYVESTLITMANWSMAHLHQESTIAIPALGCGLGGLNWPIVRSMTYEILDGLPMRVLLFGPK